MVEVKPYFSLKKNGEIGYFVSTELEKLCWLTHAFSTRWGGVSFLPERALNLSYITADRKGKVVANRYKFLIALNIPSDALLTLKQVHGNRVFVIDKPYNQQQGQNITADALVTNQSSLALATQVADCYPVLLVDKKRKVIANIHIGWRGALRGIVQQTVAAMQRHFGCQIEDLKAVIGPGIGKCCYEVGSEVIEEFKKVIQWRDNFWLPSSAGSFFLDLLGIIKCQLLFQGLNSNQIRELNLCTSCYLNYFFSYRSEGKETGRMMAVIFKR